MTMSKSLEFCKTRASDPTISKYADRDWSKATEHDIRPFLADLPGPRYTLSSGDGDYGVYITVDPDADFDYFTSNSFLSDGTLVFLLESIENLVQKVITLGSYNKELGPPEPGNTVNIVVGNYVLLTEYGKFDTENGAWLNERTTVLLPIKMTYEKGIRLGKDEVMT